jgi:hypothetical protein
MPLPRAEKDRRREQVKARRRETFDRILAALEVLQAAGVPGRLVWPIDDDRPIQLLVNAQDMPARALAARVARRSLGDAHHTIAYTGDFGTEALEAMMATSLPLEALYRHLG